MYRPHPIQWLRNHRRGADTLLTLLVVALSLAVHLRGESVDERNATDPTWWTALFVLAGTVPIYWRRTNPLIAGLLVVAAQVAALFIGLSGIEFLASVIAVYSIGAHTVGVQVRSVLPLDSQSSHRLPTAVAP
jgi:hypothetical protein